MGVDVAAPHRRGHCEEGGRSCGHHDYAGSREHFHVSSDSSELEGGPGLYQHHPPVLAALRSLAGKKNDAAVNTSSAPSVEQEAAGNEDGANRSATAAAAKQKEDLKLASDAAAARRHALEEQERLYVGLTSQRHTSVVSEASKSGSNAIYNYLLPGAPSTNAPTPPPPQQWLATTTAVAARATAAPEATTAAPSMQSPGNGTEGSSVARTPPPPLCSSGAATPPTPLDDGQSTQPGGGSRKEDLLDRKHGGQAPAPQQQQQCNSAPQHPVAAAVGATDIQNTVHCSKNSGGGPPTPLLLTPLRPSRVDHADRGDTDDSVGVSGNARGAEHASRRGRTQVSGQSNKTSKEQELEELGPMDCADAFQYFYEEDEDAYGDVESVVYVAPSQVLLARSKEATREYYLHQRAALRGSQTSSFKAEGEAAPMLGVLGAEAAFHTASASAGAAMADLFLLRGASNNHGSCNVASSLGTPTPPSPSLKAPGLALSYSVTDNSHRDSSTCASYPLNTYMSLECARRSGSDPAYRRDVAAASHNCCSTFAEVAEELDRPPNDAGRFVSVVEEMYVACRCIGHAPFICWRSIDRIAPLQEAPRRLFHSGDNSRSRYSTGSMLQSARGEVEDDVSHLPGAPDTAQSSDAPQPRTAADFLKSYYYNQHDNDGSKGVAKAKQTAACSDETVNSTAAASLYYLGPQQYLTASVWWSRVEAFSFGLRSIGLRPGDFIGIVEDTRWEWLVTCYAAWNTGLVVVAFDASARTLHRVALDTWREMKAVVCSPHVHSSLRQHFAAAAATAALHHAEETARERKDKSHNSSSNSLTEGREGRHDRSARTQEGEDDDRARSATGAREDAEPWSLADGTGGRQSHSNTGGTATESASTDITVHSQASQPHRQHGRQQQPQQQRLHTSPLFIIVRSVVPARDGEEGQRARATVAPAKTKRSDTSHHPQGGRKKRGGKTDNSSNRHDSIHACSVSEDANEHEDDDEEEEEEALWWSDILSHGESKLVAWRRQKARERRQFQQRQARLRLQQQQQQQRQRWSRTDPTMVASINMPNSLRDRSCGGGAGGGGGGNSRESSAVSTTITAPTLGWAAASAATAGTAATSPAPSANMAAPVMPAAEGSGTGYVRAPSPTYTGAVHHVAHSANVGSSVVTLPTVTAAASSLSGPQSSPFQPQQQPLQHTQQNTSGPQSYPNASTQLPLAPLRPDDLAFILYTEGDPKGVLLTHGAVKASLAAHQAYLDTTDIDFDDGLRRGGGSGASNGGGGGAAAAGGSGDGTNSGSSGNKGSSEGVNQADGEHRAGRLGRYYASAGVMPALRSRTAPAGRPTYLAYLPLHHISEFIAETTFLVRGVVVCYGTRRTLFDAFARPHGDLTEYRPTVFPALPATLARLHRAVQAMLSTGYRKLLFEVAYEARRQAIRRGLQSPFVLSTIFAQPRELLGGRCRLVLVREAPLHPRDQEYLEVVCGVSVVQQHGPVEMAGCGLQQAYCSALLDSVGGPLGPVQVKLRDVRGGWTHQSERPTGELLLCGPTVMAGYYCQPERTAEVLEKSGWFHSNMVVERCPNGAFRLVGSLRPHHALTSNGQYVDLEQLEAIYARHPLCCPDGVCLLVHPYRRYLCALVLTSEERVRAFVDAEVGAAVGASATTPSSSSGVPASPLAALANMSTEPGWWPRCLRESSLNDAAARSLAAWAAGNGGAGGDEISSSNSGGGLLRVAPHERVRHVRVLYDVWDAARHTRTATGRLLRYGIHCRYGAIIHELFAEPD